MLLVGRLILEVGLELDIETPLMASIAVPGNFGRVGGGQDFAEIFMGHRAFWTKWLPACRFL
jgi:hypothetical protein